MNLIEALKFFYAGKSVRRKNNESSILVNRRFNEITDRVQIDISKKNFFADDWEIINE